MCTENTYRHTEIQRNVHRPNKLFRIHYSFPEIINIILEKYYLTQEFDNMKKKFANKILSQFFLCINGINEDVLQIWWKKYDRNSKFSPPKIKWVVHFLQFLEITPNSDSSMIHWFDLWRITANRAWFL